MKFPRVQFRKRQAESFIDPAKPPFLLLGAGRGGTSLLAACLSGHSGIAMAMEYMGWSHLMGLSLAHKAPPAIFDERVKAFRRGCLQEIQRHPDQIWANKLTTEQLAGLEDHNALNPPYQNLITRFCEEAVPEFHILFILRDGRSTVASKVRRTGQSWEQAAFRWHQSVRMYWALSKQNRPFHAVRFEELVREPESVLRDVCAFLDLPFEESMLHQTESHLLLPEYRMRGIDPAKADIPELPESILAFLKPDLVSLGYLG